MKSQKTKLLFLILLVILAFSLQFNIANAATTDSYLKDFYEPPKISLKASQTKFDNVQVIFNDPDGIKVSTAKIYAVDAKGNEIKNVSFLIGNAVASADKKQLTYTISNSYLNKQTKTFHMKIEDNKGAVLEGTFRIAIKNSKYYALDVPPRLNSWSLASNKIKFISKDNSGTSLLEIYDLNKNNKKVKYSTPSLKNSEAEISFNLSDLTAKNGAYKIKVRAIDGSKKNKQEGNYTIMFSVAQKTVAVTGVTLNKTKTEMENGSTLQLITTVTPSNATNKEVTYSSDKTSIAKVDTNGKIIAESVGKAKITVTTKDGNKTASINVTVKAKPVAVTGVTLNQTSTSLAVGKTLNLVATVTPSNATNKTVKFTSNNTKVAKVNKNTGVVKAIGEGTAKITAKTANGNKATCKITVKIVEYATYSDDTINVKTELIDNVYVTKIWVKDPSKQVKKASATWGTTLKTVEQQMRDKSDAIVACNGGGFMRANNWEPAENSLYKTLNLKWDKTSSGNLVLTNGKTMRALKNASGAELKTNGQVGILPNGSLKFYTGTTYKNVIDDGVKNTFTFTGYMLINNGVINSNCDSINKAIRNCVGQIDANNYVILTSYTNETIKRMAEVGKKVGCQYLYNFDGGGSTTLWMKNLVAYHPKYGEIRPVANALYFTTTKKYSEKNGALYREVNNNLGDSGKYLWETEIY